MAVSLAQSPSQIEALTTLEAISAQFQQIQLNLDTLHDQRYEDHNELLAYINLV